MAKKITCDLCNKDCGGKDGERMIGGLYLYYNERRNFMNIDICDECGKTIEESIKDAMAKRNAPQIVRR